jgi:hypothetical protein
MEDTLEVVRLTGYRGTMTKNISEMTPAEYKEWQIELNNNVRILHYLYWWTIHEIR